MGGAEEAPLSGIDCSRGKDLHCTMPCIIEQPMEVPQPEKDPLMQSLSDWWAAPETHDPLAGSLGTWYADGQQLPDSRTNRTQDYVLDSILDDTREDSKAC